MSTESDLHLHGLKAGVDVGANEVSASGPDAEAPAVAGSGFERCWAAYRKFGNKQAARKAFEAIANPDVDHIARRASAWAFSAKPGQRRMPFEKWLAAEKFDEADRNVRQEPRAAVCQDVDQKEEGEVRRRRTDAEDAVESAEYARTLSLAAIEIGVPRNASLTVRDATIEDRDGNRWLAMMTDVGTVALLIEGNNASLQDEGQAHLGRLAEAAGAEINEPADVIGCTFMIVGDTFADVALAA